MRISVSPAGSFTESSIRRTSELLVSHAFHALLAIPVQARGSQHGDSALKLSARTPISLYSLCSSQTPLKTILPSYLPVAQTQRSSAKEASVGPFSQSQSIMRTKGSVRSLQPFPLLVLISGPCRDCLYFVSDLPFALSLQMLH